MFGEKALEQDKRFYSVTGSVLTNICVCSTSLLPDSSSETVFWFSGNT